MKINVQSLLIRDGQCLYTYNTIYVLVNLPLLDITVTNSLVSIILPLLNETILLFI